MGVLIFGFVLNRLFPSRSTVEVQIYSEKVEEIRNELFNSKYEHTLTIHNNIGGYSLQPKKSLTTICLYIEVPRLIRHIRKIDGDCLISIKKIIGMDGKYSMYQQGSTE